MNRSQPADPNTRRKAIWVIVGIALLGVLTIGAFSYLQRDLEAWLVEHIDYLLANTHLVFLATLLAVSPLFVLTTYLIAFGRRVARAQRFPPSGFSVIKETSFIEGPEAVRRGVIIQVLAAILLGGSAAIPFLIWYIFHSLSAAGQ